MGATGPGTQEAPGKNEVLGAFILGFARFQVGCSARFNDLQHVHPKDLIHTSNTVELKAAVMALVPGVHPGLRLPDGDPPGAPHVPGQLAHGEHGRCLRTGEAQRGCGDLGPGSAEGPQPEPRPGTQGGLESPGLGGPAPAPAVDITDAGLEGREDQIEKEGEASPLVPSGSAPSARSWSVVAKDLFPATPDLPLRVVAAVKRTGNAGQSRIHLLNVEGTAVGCGWRPAAS